MTSTKKQFHATTFRLTLAGVLILILAGIGGGFYLAYISLKETAEETARIQSEANSSDAKTQQLLNTKAQLEKNAEVVKKAEQIVAESRSYQYQNQIINDLTMYANQAGLAVRSFSFQSESQTPVGTTSPSPETGTGGAGTSTPPSATSSVKSVVVAVELSGDLSYLPLLRFLNLIEQNLTRMQVTSLSLSGDSQGEGASSQTLNIEVYVR